MHILEKAESSLTRLLEGFISACLLLVFVLIVTLVVLRYVFNMGIVGANETATILFVYGSAIGSAVAIGRREHISVPFLVEKLRGRARQLADVVALALVAMINGVILWESLRWIMVTGQYIMPATQLPRIVAQASVPIGCGLALVYCLVRIASTLKGGHRASSA